MICPLTPLEQYFRQRGGEAGYTGGLVEYDVTGALYPNGLTRELQIALGSGLFLRLTATRVFALGLNLVVVAYLIYRLRQKQAGNVAVI